MKNTKKIIAALAVSISIFGAVPAFATIVGRGQIMLLYSPSLYAEGKDSYVTATTSGTMFEDHYYGLCSPTAFTAELELRTAWYLPNDVKDTSHDPNSWNKAVDIKAGDEFRTYVKANGINGQQTDLYTVYDNY